MNISRRRFRAPAGYDILFIFGQKATFLEQAGDFSGFRININLGIGRIGAGSGHKRNSSSHWNQEFGS